MSKTQQMNFKKLGLIASGTAAGALVVSNTVFRKIDPRTRALLSILTGLVFVSFKSKNSIGIGGGFWMAAAVDVINSLRGGAISENKHNGYIWVLMENGQTLRKLKPYQTIGVLHKIDGIATSYKPGCVYKVPTACMVRILSNGDVELSSAFSRSINDKLDEKAGWKDKNFLQQYPSWQGLFEKSLELCSCS
jgi:hypothetical protein